MYRIIQGDCLESLKKLPDQHVHCCVTSPPYFGQRDYGVEGQLGLEKTPMEYVEKLVAIFREVRRVLRDDGTLWLNLGDSYAANRSYQVPSTKGGAKHGPAQGVRGRGSTVPDGLKPKDLIGIPWSVAFALREDGWWLRQDIIWNKPNAMPSSVTDRCTTAHEYIFLLAKSERYYYDHVAVQEPAVCNHSSGNGFAGRQGGSEHLPMSGGHGTEEEWKPGGMRNRRSVWTIPTRPFKGAHFAVFPPNLIEPCILAGCPRDGLVLDPFCGSGTTGVVALKHGRSFTGIELNPEYVKMATERIESSRPAKLGNLFD